MDNTIMAKIKITQVKSKIGSTKKQKATIEALGIKKTKPYRGKRSNSTDFGNGENCKPPGKS
jgi:large subunit ribosomal protein L30